jgi:hypothetical protein
MQFDSDCTKKRYFRPILTKLTPEQAKQFLADRIPCNDEEADVALDSLRQEAELRKGEKRQLPA